MPDVLSVEEDRIPEKPESRKKGDCMKLEFCATVYENGIPRTTRELVPFADDGGREEQLINLYPQMTYQTLDGFGGAITDSAAYIYSLLNENQKRELLESYFGSDQMRYRFVRIPIDSCDFSISHYEADGEEEDENLEHFSFERVERYILPMLRDAEAVFGGKIEIMLTPWSPPAYMKSNGQRNFGGKLRACYQKRWAEYICRYIQEYRSRGFHVTMLTLQNEPKAVQTWDSCIFTAQEEKEFLCNAMWPALTAHGLNDIEIYIWDHNKERAFEWAQTIIDEKTDAMIAGIAFHWYSGDHFEALRMIRERFPGKKLLLSEACIEFRKYREEDYLGNAEKYAHELIGNLNEGMCVFLDWNLILDEVGGPNHVGNYCDAPFLFHTGEKRLMQREIQRYLEHFTRYLTPGSVRIGFSRYTDQIELTAFQNGNALVVVFLNRTEKPLPAYLRVHDQCVPVFIAPRSIATGVITDYQN